MENIQTSKNNFAYQIFRNDRIKNELNIDFED